MDPRKPKDFKRLVSAVRESYRKLVPFREKRKRLLESFVGSEYSDDAQAKKVYLYFLSMATSIYVRQLAVRAPTAKITTPHSSLRPLAKNFELACDDTAKDTHLGKLLRRAAADSLFSPKVILKVGLEYMGKQEVSGEMVDVTEPFIAKVSFDDYVCDMSARSAGDPMFEGDMYYLPRDEFDLRYPGAWEKLGLAASDLGMTDDHGAERAEALSHAPGSGEDNAADRITMQDVWLPKRNQLVTYVVNKAERALEVIDFDAPEDGPYHSLWYNDVPDNAMPLPPFAAVRNLHELANGMFRRLAHQVQNQKRVAAFSDEEGAKRFKAASDGDGIFWNGQKPEEVSVGGVDQQVLATFVQVKDIFSWAAGNLDTLGGLSPQSDTVGQEELLSNSANAQLADMQDAMAEFTRGIFRQLSWYEWTDPVRERTLQKEIPGVGDYIAVKWTPETRQGDFLDFNFSINPHSMRDDNPSTKLQKIRGIINEFYIPLQPFFQQQGLGLDVRRLNDILGDYSNLPELDQLIVALDPNQFQQADGPVGNPIPVSKPSSTTRKYVRINRPGATRAGKDGSLMQTLLGGKVQPAEAAAAGRAVG